MADFARFFRWPQRPSEVDPDTAVLNEVNEILDFASTAYYPKFIAYLDREASKPIAISSDHMVMIQSAVRANTLREIQSTLVRWVNHARAAATQVEDE